MWICQRLRAFENGGRQQGLGDGARLSEFPTSTSIQQDPTYYKLFENQRPKNAAVKFAGIEYANNNKIPTPP